MTSVEGAYFEAMYAESEDPWGFHTRWYERRKRTLTAASLPRERYASAFEPGCSVGALTRELAPRCDALLAWERVPAAKERARRDLARFAHVAVQLGSVPWEWPQGDFDLIVLSELLYYFGDADLHELLDLTTRSLRPGGNIVAVHWRHQAQDHTRSGDDAHHALAAHSGLVPVGSHSEADFLLDLYTTGRGADVSVAQRDGLV